MEENKVITGFKGFDKNMQCRGFQFEEGKEYETETAEACKSGFHACEYPLDVFGYYDPANSVFHTVEQSGNTDKNNEDSKVASTKIKIGARIDIKGLIKASFEYVKERCTNSEVGKDNSALTGGDSSALTGGDSSALTGGDSSALTGGNYSVVYGCGIEAKVRGGIGAVLALDEFDENYNLVKVHVKAVDGKKIKANTFYTLKNGKFVAVK